jgi:hypothetical protein
VLALLFKGKHMKLLIEKGGATLTLRAEHPDDRVFIKRLVVDHVEPPKVPAAEIQLELREDGQIHFFARCAGQLFCIGPTKPQEQALTVELPKLIAELREKMAQQKPLTQQ